MANSQTGQISLGGKALTLKYGWAAFTKLADALGCTVQNIDAVTEDMPVSALNKVVWAGLQRHHPDLDQQAVDDMLDDAKISEAKAVIGAAGALFRASMSDMNDADKTEAAGKAPASPPAASPSPSESST